MKASQLPFDFVRRDKIVGVKHLDEATRRLREGAIARGGRTCMALLDQSRAGEAADFANRIILRPVINHDDLELRPRLTKYRLQSLADKALCVVARDQNGN